MLTTVDHVQLAMPVGSEDVARGFYVDVLGFDEVSKPVELAKRGGVWFRSGNIALHVGIDDRFVAARKAHPAFRCDDYDVLMAHLARRGIAVNQDPLPFEGRPHCYLADPFGNRIEIIG